MALRNAFDDLALDSTLQALAGAVGYKDGWTRWAWQYAQQHSRRT